MINNILFILFKSLTLLIPVLITVAFFTLIERKLMALVQRRKGPNVIGLFGLLQAFSDGLKLIVKEMIFPISSNTLIFILGPFITFFLALLNWSIIPFSEINEKISNFNYELLYIYAISSLGVYGIILSGWASNSKYSILGALRSTAQMVSYELSIGFIFLIVALITNSFNLYDIIIFQKNNWFLFLLLPIFIIFLITMLAETNRHPFDLPEAEAELVSGYNTEYSGIKFVFFFLGEYSNMFFMACLGSILFLGGWLSPFLYLDLNFWFSLKILLFMFFFIWCRILLPRYRYDQLMNIGWKIFLPLLFIFFLFYSSILKSLNLYYININYFSIITYLI